MLQTLKELITNTLNAAHAEKLSSLAFPSIGTKGCRVPHEDLAKIMMEAIQEFSQNRPQTSLNQICIVAHIRDSATVTVSVTVIKIMISSYVSSSKLCSPEVPISPRLQLCFF